MNSIELFKFLVSEGVLVEEDLPLIFEALRGKGIVK